jgi:hypothetical protein
MTATAPPRPVAKRAAPCGACLEDSRALQSWQANGGPLPPKTCSGHLVSCRGCRKRVYVVNEDGRCDRCWIVREHKERPLSGVVAEPVAAVEEDPVATAAKLAAALAEFERADGVSVTRK